MFALIGALIFLLITIFTFLVAWGLPLGEFTMGGQHKVLPKPFRLMALLSLAVQIFAIIIILQSGNYITLWFTPKITKYICIFYTVYLSLNSIMNFLSNSKKEKYVMTPLSLLAAICFGITAFRM